jgi:cell division protein ZapD
MINDIIYEHPLNERNRTFMRVEYLFDKMEHFLSHETHWDIFIAIQTLIELINILERNDISSDVIKELDRYQISFTKLLDVPVVDREKLEFTLEQLKIQLTNMQAAYGKHTKQLRNDELLNTIRQKLALSTNLCSFDIPGLYYWLHQDNAVQQQQFCKWLEELDTIKTSLKLILQLIRNSAIFEDNQANCGFFQTALEHNNYYQIIRIKVPQVTAVFPEISGNKHRITVRFLTFLDSTCRPQQTTEDIAFELGCCHL